MGPEGPPIATTRGASMQSNTASTDAPRSVTPLDFTVQNQLSREDARHLEIAHEPFARALSRSWSAGLRALVTWSPSGSTT